MAGTRMTKCLLAVVLLAAAVAAPAQDASSAPTLTEALSLDSRYSSNSARVDAAKEAARMSIVRDAATTYGVQAGYAARAQEIRDILHGRVSRLDAIYNCEPLMIRGRMVPPVVELVERVQAIDNGGRVMRETAQVYRVTRAAELTTTPPTWRAWLTIAPRPVQRPDDQALPASAAERRVWEAAVRKAWSYGVKQANAVVTTQLHKLTHDYEGMLRYRRLVAKGVISPAQMQQTGDSAVVNAEQLRVEDQLFAVAADAQFQKPEEWKAEPAISPVAANRGAAK